MTKIEPKLLKGFRDFEPKIQLVRQSLIEKIQSSFESFGFLPMDTPVLEYKEILMGKYGDDEKLVYSFEDNGGRQVAMRYDLTVPMARFVAANQGWLTFPFKRYQIAPVWRADKPQKGRYREFYQCDIDVIGSDSVLSDAEVIACLCKALEAVGIKNYKVRINDRAVFADFSQDAVRIIDKVEKIGVDGMINEMRGRGISDNQIELAKQLVQGQGFSLPERLAEVIKLTEQFELQGQVKFDPTIARGLDYYSGTVFEIFLNDKPEYGSICSGGRYDGLLDQFSDKPEPAVGGSIGIDRLFAAMEDLGLLPQIPPATAIILNLDKKLRSEYIKLAQELRAQKVDVEVYYDPAKLDKQFKYAEQKGIAYAVLIGEEEQKQGQAQLKNIRTREQETLTQTELIKTLIEASSN